MKKIRKQIILIILSLIIVLVSVSAVSATDIYVNSSITTPGDGSSWDQAVKNITDGYTKANDNDTIKLANGQYTGEGNTNITIAKNMNIIGQSQAGTIINGTNLNWIFYIKDGVTVTIQDLTIANANATCGSAIYNDGNLTVNDCTFTSNTATGDFDDGGGAAIFNTGALIVTDSTFKDNDATASDSAAVYNYGGTLNVTRSTFKDNAGGAIVNENGGALMVSDSNFISNTAIYYGGAIWNSGNCTVIGSTFTGNNATLGGAIYSQGILNLTNSIIQNNKAVGELIEQTESGGNGGGIFLSTYSSYSIISNQILNNIGSGISIGGQLQGTSVSASNDVEEKALINFNRFYGNTPYGIYYDSRVGSTGEVSAARPLVVINATLNWWGSNGGPNSTGADKTNLASTYYAPWIVMGFTPTQVTLNGGQTTQLIANFLYDNLGNYHDPANGHIPDGTPVTFTTTLGQVGSQTITKYTVNGIATAILRAWNAAGEPVWGTAFITAATDAQLLSSSVTMLEVPTANAKTIGMLPTGVPLAGFALAILMVFGGLVAPKRK